MPLLIDIAVVWTQLVLAIVKCLSCDKLLQDRCSIGWQNVTTVYVLLEYSWLIGKATEVAKPSGCCPLFVGLELEWAMNCDMPDKVNSLQIASFSKFLIMS